MNDYSSEAPSSESIDSSVADSGIDKKESESKEIPSSYAGTKHKVKIDSQELEVPYEELVSNYQRRGSSEKRFQEAARLKKEVDEFIGSLKSGDLKRLKEVGIPQDKIREFAEAELLEYIQYEQLSDADKARIQAERERDELKSEKQLREEQDKKTYLAQIEQEAVRELDSEIAESIKELKADMGIDPKKPIEPWFVDHIARLMIAHLETDETAEKMPAKLATQRAWKGVEDTVKSYLGAIPSDKALAMLPRELRDAIRKADVDDAVGSQMQRIRTKQQSGSDKSAPSRKEKPSTDDFFSRLDKRFG